MYRLTPVLVKTTQITDTICWRKNHSYQNCCCCVVPKLDEEMALKNHIIMLSDDNDYAFLHFIFPTLLLPSWIKKIICLSLLSSLETKYYSKYSTNRFLEPLKFPSPVVADIFMETLSNFNPNVGLRFVNTFTIWPHADIKCIMEGESNMPWPFLTYGKSMMVLVILYIRIDICMQKLIPFSFICK